MKKNLSMLLSIFIMTAMTPAPLAAAQDSYVTPLVNSLHTLYNHHPYRVGLTALLAAHHLSELNTRYQVTKKITNGLGTASRKIGEGLHHSPLYFLESPYQWTVNSVKNAQKWAQNNPTFFRWFVAMPASMLLSGITINALADSNYLKKDLGGALSDAAKTGLKTQMFSMLFEAFANVITTKALGDAAKPHTDQAKESSEDLATKFEINLITLEDKWVPKGEYPENCRKLFDPEAKIKVFAFEGPPGLGKTELVNTIAKQLYEQGSITRYYYFNGAQAVSKWAHGGADRLKNFFDDVLNAAKNEKVVIAFDEYERLANPRDDNGNVIAQDASATTTIFMDGLNRCKAHPNIKILLASNFGGDKLEQAVNNRVDERYVMQLPDEKTRYAIIHSHFIKGLEEQYFDLEHDKTITYIAQKIADIEPRLIGYLTTEILELHRQGKIRTIDIDIALSKTLVDRAIIAMLIRKKEDITGNKQMAHLVDIVKEIDQRIQKTYKENVTFRIAQAAITEDRKKFMETLESERSFVESAHQKSLDEILTTLKIRQRSEDPVTAEDQKAFKEKLKPIKNATDGIIGQQITHLETLIKQINTIKQLYTNNLNVVDYDLEVRPKIGTLYNQCKALLAIWTFDSKQRVKHYVPLECILDNIATLSGNTLSKKTSKEIINILDVMLNDAQELLEHKQPMLTLLQLLYESPDLINQEKLELVKKELCTQEYHQIQAIIDNLSQAKSEGKNFASLDTATQQVALNLHQQTIANDYAYDTKYDIKDIYHVLKTYDLTDKKYSTIKQSTLEDALKPSLLKSLVPSAASLKPLSALTAIWWPYAIKGAKQVTTWCASNKQAVAGTIAAAAFGWYLHNKTRNHDVEFIQNNLKANYQLSAVQKNSWFGRKSYTMSDELIRENNFIQFMANVKNLKAESGLYENLRKYDYKKADTTAKGILGLQQKRFKILNSMNTIPEHKRAGVFLLQHQFDRELNEQELENIAGKLNHTQGSWHVNAIKLSNLEFDEKSLEQLIK